MCENPRVSVAGHKGDCVDVLYTCCCLRSKTNTLSSRLALSIVYSLYCSLYCLLGFVCIFIFSSSSHHLFLLKASVPCRFQGRLHRVDKRTSPDHPRCWGLEGPATQEHACLVFFWFQSRGKKQPSNDECLTFLTAHRLTHTASFRTHHSLSNTCSNFNASLPHPHLL